ncbi:MAG: hypothetical protein JWM36_3181 [Hyphomicrobiales bacterium]|nr:hypothetical protein [Hyphomicrobiales bacterium]
MNVVETKLTIIRPGMKTETLDMPDLPIWPGLDRLRRTLCVKGRLGEDVHLEHVSVLIDGRPTDMFVDEDGMSKGLPVNVAATKIYRANSLLRNPDLDAEKLPKIVGPAVVFSRRVWS